MFCRQCGNEIPDTAKFCPVCGAKSEKRVPVPTYGETQSPPQPSAPPRPAVDQGYGVDRYGQDSYANPSNGYQGQELGHPEYRTMGGWLLFFMIDWLIGGAYAIYAAFTLFQFSGTFGFLGSYGAGWVPALMIFLGLVLIAEGIAIFYYVYLVFSRREEFLWWYQTMCIVAFVCVGIVIIVSYTSMIPLTSLWGTIVGGVVGMLLLTYYFCNSVRVRTFMGSDNYKKRAIFTLGS